MTDIDALAETLAVAHRHDPTAWYLLGEPGREPYRTMAWAALLSMVEAELGKRSTCDGWYRLELDGDLLHIWPSP